MEKQKPWQFYLIIAVLVITLYNILPTLFYYTKPLKSPIDAPRAHEVAVESIERVNDLQADSVAWLYSFNKLLGIKPVSIQPDANDHELFELVFKNQSDATLFKRFLPKAGSMIPFVPSQLKLAGEASQDQDSFKVLVQRNIAVNITPNEAEELFLYTPKYNQPHHVADAYRKIANDRVVQVATAIAGVSKPATQMAYVVANPTDSRSEEAALSLSREVIDIDRAFGKNDSITKRYFATFTQDNSKDAKEIPQKFIAQLESYSKHLKEQSAEIKKTQAGLIEKGELANITQEEKILSLDNQAKTFDAATAVLKQNSSSFSQTNEPLTFAKLLNELNSEYKGQPEQTLDLTGHNPYIQSLTIDWENSKIHLNLYSDVQKIRLADVKSEKQAILKDKINHYLINTIAGLAQQSDETFNPSDDTFVVNLDQLTNSQSYLVLNLGYVAKKRAQQVLDQLLLTWTPEHQDFTKETYPIYSYDQFKTLKPEDQRMGLVVYAPAMYEESSLPGFRNQSIYIIAKGMENLIQKYKEAPEEKESQVLVADFNQLGQLLQKMNFIGYPASAFGFPKEFQKDYIFELNDYYSNLIDATRENFTVKGSQRYAVLDFTDVEQRILTRNRIEDRQQDDLLKWKEAYHAAQISQSPTDRYLIPAPTKNVFLENLKLSAFKYFRGDDRKILKWGLDLSGGKTVRIGLLDQNNKPVTNPDDLKQAVNELYNRVNKMGLSERTIRVESSNILLDFPGSQGLSASDLVKASAMYFHIANEKFSPTNPVNPSLASATNQFLQDVWNEAVVTNRKDIDSINEIAWEHLGGNPSEGGSLYPRSEAAKVLYDAGLRLANTKDKAVNSTFNDTLSSVAMYRGTSFAEWNQQPNPLLFVFHNYALEGANLEDIQVGYDAMDGNFLSFNVRSSYQGNKESGGSGSPRDDFYLWTSQFAKDKIEGTSKEAFNGGRGWRMAVIFNGQVISAPTLGAALSNAARITGRFSQREINQLAADLKAGSLSFTPKILSEENVSPELGLEERSKGITASLLALVLVVVAMCGYYRFAGLVASCAVLLNIFIMWGVLQNLGAAITLPGIAGIVLTIGMAVDANVLVFERIREEFAISGRIGSAIHAGYKKAFSAIIDSNITTIIAAIILIQFDSGPIKGFAVTLIIGILSSMFTALFMTRYFFAGWIKNPEHKQLSMARFLKNTNFDFLSKARQAIIISLVAIAAGGYLLYQEHKTIFGMDFTGGYSLTVDLEEKPDHPNYRLAAINALQDHGASRSDFEIRELSRPNQIRLQLGTSMNEKGHPFYQMPEDLPEGKYAYEYQKDPRLNWVVQSLADSGLNVQPSELAGLEKNWKIISGQFSDAMRNNAAIGLGLALLAILIYITFRFEFKYAIGAVVGLIHDVFITLGILALFHMLGFAVQIDLQVIGAIMTIIGYSLNDTIIVFDRIREDVKLMRRSNFSTIINHALNVTLSRTIMTSGTTLLVLLALVLFGGQSIFSFSLVMTIGVVIGTLSSLFIASPVMLYFHNKEEQKAEEGNELKKVP